MNVEVETADETRTFHHVQHVEQREDSVYVEFEDPQESDDPCAVTEVPGGLATVSEEVSRVTDGN